MNMLKSIHLKFFLIASFLLCAGISLNAQQSSETKSSRVDLFLGADFNYRDIFHNKIYEVLLNATPGVKWHFGNHWMLSGQAIVPIYNDYGERYKKLRLNMAVLSKEWNFGETQFFKMSGGLFGSERYGLDLKYFYPINKWLALDAQVGLTGFCSMAVDWECSKMDRVTGWAGAKCYLPRTNTEFRLRAGRFIYADYGVMAEAMRHFKNTTVGLYAQYSDIFKENGGFKIVMMLPPYHWKAKRVTLRPASNFRLTYNVHAQPYSTKMYNTDPEENEREGYFENENLHWGQRSMNSENGVKEGGAQ